MRIPFAMTCVLAGLVFQIGPASACGKWDLGCEAREVVKNPGKKVGEGINNTGRVIDQGRVDLSNSLNRVDPRITQVGRDIDRWRLDLQSQVLTGPALAQWIIRSRNDAMRGALPIPEDVKRAMSGWYTENDMSGVFYKIADNGVFNLSHGALTYGDADAITLIDVIVFKNGDISQDMSTWAHELKHVTQYKQWGVEGFAERYMQGWSSVENPAYDVQHHFENHLQDPNAAGSPTTSGGMPSSQSVIVKGPQLKIVNNSPFCVVGPRPTDRCLLPQSQQIGANCSCQGQDRQWFGTVAQ